MRIEAKVYLGAYIRCEYKAETRPLPAYRCSKVMCRLHPPDPHGKTVEAAPFCALCGSPREKAVVQAPYRPDVYDIVHDELQSRTIGSHVLLISNRIGEVVTEGVARGEIDYLDADVEICLEDARPAPEIASFEKTFAEEIEKLKVAFEKVEIKWGLLVWTEE